MTIQQLRYIVAIDQYRNFGKAAVACDVTQSTLSLMVKKLEEELDVRLFSREVFPLEPTEIGRKVIAKAKEVLYNVDQIAELTQNEKHILQGTLSVAMISTVAPVLVAGLFKYTCTKCPAVQLQTEEMLSETIKDKLHKAEIDMGIMASPVNDPGLLEIPLFTERFFAYVSDDDPAYQLDTISFNEIVDRPIWIMKKGVRQYSSAAIRDDQSASYEKYFEGGRVSALLEIVNEMGGMTIIPETHLALILYSWQKNVREMVNPARSRTISLVIRQDYIHEQMLNLVIKAVKASIPASLIDSGIKKDHIRL